MQKRKVKGITEVVISALLYGFTPCICSITYALGNNQTSMTFFRNLLALPVFLLLLLLEKVDLAIDRITMLKIFILGNLGSLMTTLLLYSSYQYISVGMATTIHFLYPVLVVIFSFLFYKEPVTKQKICSIFCAGTGIVCFLLNSHTGSIIGILLAFGSSITFSLYIMLLDKWKLTRIHGCKLLLYTTLLTVIELALANLKGHFLIFNQSLKVYLLMVLVAVLASFVANLFLNNGVRLLGSTLASFLSLFEPISSILFGFLLLHETVSFLQIAGCIAIIFAIINLIGLTEKAEI